MNNTKLCFFMFNATVPLVWWYPICFWHHTKFSFTKVTFHSGYLVSFIRIWYRHAYIKLHASLYGRNQYIHGYVVHYQWNYLRWASNWDVLLHGTIWHVFQLTPTTPFWKLMFVISYHHGWNLSFQLLPSLCMIYCLATGCGPLPIIIVIPYNAD